MDGLGELIFGLCVCVGVFLFFMHKCINEKKAEKEQKKIEGEINITECTSSLFTSMKKMRDNLDTTLKMVENIPNDYNDKQNLNNKYNKGTYRDEKGMFRSLNTTLYEEYEY
tara:strand:+ start:1519 stop:1854 length:336 start_codon:yes stop_codon:yes gene_type:complete